MNHQENTNSGLLRFRSAPSSLYSNLPINRAPKGDLSENRGLTHFDSPNFIEEFQEQKPNLNGFLSNSLLPPQYPKQSSSSMVGSNLMRQSSSPVAHFSHVSPKNGFGASRGVGNYRMGYGGNTNGDIISPSSSRLRSPLCLPSLGTLPQISEIGNENIDKNWNNNANLGNRYPLGSWSDSSHFPNHFSVHRKDQENEAKLIPSSQNQEIGARENILSHHLSLPKASADVAAVDTFLRFQDTVPCKVRAKRGCATHPRSIAERVRRTRISERMRKLQELVPNMDKQTNTAEMLDLAVEYIKDLQKQYEILSENRGKCECSNMQKSLQNF